MCAAQKEKKGVTTIYRQREIERLEKDVEELRRLASTEDSEAEVERLKREVLELRREFYTHLGPWQRAQIARHPQRPYTLDWINLMITDFIELHGDRGFGDDKALITGLGKFRGRSVAVIGHQKGRDTKQRVVRNFGQPKPEGYRKALRVMQLAAKFGRPILTFIDTPGAYPGIDAEERGQAEAIAHNIETMAALETPLVAAVIGEGGSGGALAIAVGDRVLMLENAVYSVISPEGCAAILWRDSSQKERAAEALKLTAPDLLALGLIDEIVPEPPGGAHADADAAAVALGAALERHLAELAGMPVERLKARRAEKYLRMGRFEEDPA